MHDPEKYKNKTVRAKPSQARGHERVRLILMAALELFKERGFEEVTTNDIAERANIPIGSLYRYYPNKEAIIAALTELYVEDVMDVFAAVGKHPMLRYLSWDEVLLLMVDGWVNYSRQNGPFTFLYVERASPKLNQQNKPTWKKFMASFIKVLKKRCPELTNRQAIVCFSLCLSAAEIGTNKEYAAISPNLHHEAVGAAASYMLRICDSSDHHRSSILY